jgi:hypothetical protein
MLPPEACDINSDHDARCQRRCPALESSVPNPDRPAKRLAGIPTRGLVWCTHARRLGTTHVPISLQTPDDRVLGPRCGSLGRCIVCGLSSPARHRDVNFARRIKTGHLGRLQRIPLALWMGQSLAWLLPPNTLPIALEVKFNRDSLGFTILVCLASTLLSGMAPMLHCLRSDLNEALKEGGRGETSGARSGRMRSLLVLLFVAAPALQPRARHSLVRQNFGRRREDSGRNPPRVLRRRPRCSPVRGVALPVR